MGPGHQDGRQVDGGVRLLGRQDPLAGRGAAVEGQCVSSWERGLEWRGLLACFPFYECLLLQRSGQYSRAFPPTPSAMSDGNGLVVSVLSFWCTYKHGQTYMH